MAWKKNERGRFTPAQHQKMFDMHKAGMEISDIAEKAGCAWSTVDNAIKKLKGKKPKKNGKKKMPAVLHKALNGTDPTEEQAYLMWALRGALNKVGDKSYFERFVEDTQNGQFG
jgi:hypothetical protein